MIRHCSSFTQLQCTGITPHQIPKQCLRFMLKNGSTIVWIGFSKYCIEIQIAQRLSHKLVQQVRLFESSVIISE